MADAKFIVGSSDKNEDLLFATKFFACDDFIFLEKDGRKIMVISEFEYARAKTEARVDELLTDSEFNAKHPDVKGLYIKIFNEFSVRSVAVSKNFPAGIAKFLSDQGIIIEFQNPLFPERAIKTPKEIKDIKHAQSAAEFAFRTIIKILEASEIREGKLWYNGDFITSEALRLTFDVKLMQNNCVALETIISSGDQAVVPHCLGYGPILANSPIVMDMFPRSRKNWYWSDMTRTVVKGKLLNEARKIYQAVYETQMRACEMVKPGADFSRIQEFSEENLKRLGFETKVINGVNQGYTHSIGHGVGLEIHEAPSPSSTREVILEPGHVITIEPGLYYMGIGGVRIEDTLVVTENGHENLARIPKKLIELP